MRKFIENLKNRNFFRLWAGQVISQCGDRINQMALIGLIAGKSPGSAMGLAKLLSFTIIPVFIIGPIAGVYVDRWDRRTTLFITDFLRGLLVLTIPLIFIARESMLPIYAIVFLVFCLSRFYVPAKMSIVPDLVEEEHLLVANSLITISGMIAFVVGVTFGSLIVEALGPKAGFTWDAITFFVSSLLVATIDPNLNMKVDRKKILAGGKEFAQVFRKTLIEDLKEGFLYLKDHKEIRPIINMLFLVLSAAGAIYVIIIIFIQRVFGSVALHVGVIAAFFGLGLFLGAVFFGKWGEKVNHFKTIFICLILAGFGIILFAVVVYHNPVLILAIFLAMLLGFVIGPVMIASNTVVHKVCDDAMRGKVFTALEIVIHAGFLWTMLLSAYFSDIIGQYWVLIIVGVILFIIGIIGVSKSKSIQGGLNI